MSRFKMTNYYDKENNRLVFIKQKANPAFWDKHWNKNSFKNQYNLKSNFVVRYTQKFLPRGWRILEGGCGLGQNVYKLHKSGYNCIGIDYASQTVKLIKNTFPELDIRLGDVRNLKFKNDYFDGYWSLGVIEHFYKGYEKILDEMSRVVEKKGYVFVTFPHMSLLRRVKARLALYPEWIEKKKNIKCFYQFALDEKEVIKNFEKQGFKIVEEHYLDGYGGASRELLLFKYLFKNLSERKNSLARILMILIDFFMSRFCSHIILLVFVNKK